MKSYLFHSDRLGFRTWTHADIEPFAEMCADPAVMEHFPNVLSRMESEHLVRRMIDMYDMHGYTYFATEIVETGEFIGMIGLAYQTYESYFTPAVDIGWRLKQSAWGYGYATEGAKRSLTRAFDYHNLESLFSICTIANQKSEHVMRKIGMNSVGEFDHPDLTDFPQHQRCVHYTLSKEEYEI